MHHTTLDVWQRSIELAVAVYEKTKSLPKEETIGLRSQMRRAAVSIPSNVSEGEGRRLSHDHARFLGIARGSLYELHSQLEICRRLNYIAEADIEALNQLSTRVAQLINGTLRSVVNQRIPRRRRRVSTDSSASEDRTDPSESDDSRPGD